MIKKFFFFFLIFFLLFPLSIKAQEVEIHFFWSQNCPHCAKERVFLENLEKQDSRIEVSDYQAEIAENQQILQEMALSLKVPENLIGLVPFTIIGEKYFVGFRDEQTTGEEIKRAVEILFTNEEIKEANHSQVLKLPFLGQISTKDFSLPVLTVILGLLDGFNPCAMWALLFLISLLLGVKEKKRRWILGVAFIFTSALVYFLIMTAWLKLFLFLGFVFWVRLVVGLFALGAGFYSLRDYWKNKEGGCKAIEEEKRNKIFGRIRAVVEKKELILALGGIVLLALAVNLVEVVCSAALPAIYTQVLTLSNLPLWQYYSYLFVYIFFFMIDDLFVFGAAMLTLQMVGIESKYARYSRLIGGILILTIGMLLLLKPEWLVFS